MPIVFRRTCILQQRQAVRCLSCLFEDRSNKISRNPSGEPQESFGCPPLTRAFDPGAKISGYAVQFGINFFMPNFTKVALVTGAGSGIGRTVALALSGVGYQLVLAGRRKEALEETLAMAGTAKGSALAVAADISDPAAVRALFSQTEQAFGRLDLLFNNAGVGIPSAALEDVTAEQWQRVVQTNLSGTFYCTQEAFRLMKRQTPQGGRIINNGSISAHVPRPNSAPYTATKHAVTGLTRSTSLDGRKYNIACGQIDIGNAATEMAMRMADGVPQADGTIRPEDLIDPSIVGNAVLYMASLPLDANVQFMTVMATKMPFIGRG
jgi:NAD(P)-dependent dehydrogenase (short-subunit alcohol dehydrogenase family)